MASLFLPPNPANFSASDLVPGISLKLYKLINEERIIRGIFRLVGRIALSERKKGR